MWCWMDWFFSNTLQMCLCNNLIGLIIINARTWDLTTYIFQCLRRVPEGTPGGLLQKAVMEIIVRARIEKDKAQVSVNKLKYCVDFISS